MKQPAFKSQLLYVVDLKCFSC